MSFSFLVILALVVSLAGADRIYTEEKVSDGYKVPTTTVYGTYRSRYQSRFPYVCYDRRVRKYINGSTYLTYQGCKRYDASCSSLGRVHFGRYPNDQASYRALKRCIEARPRFVD